MLVVRATVSAERADQGRYRPADLPGSLSTVRVYGAERVPVDVLVLLDPHVVPVTITLPLRSSRPGALPWPLSAVAPRQDDSRW